MSFTHSGTRRIKVGNIYIGGNSPISVQSMCATKTTDVEKTLVQINLLKNSGADLIRIAIDSKKDVEALKAIKERISANLVVDLQENYRLAKDVAPFVEKFRYNPGHLHHHQREIPIKDKIKFLVNEAGQNNCAIRVGINFGSIAPGIKEKTPLQSAIRSAASHVDMLEEMGFEDYLVSIKSSDPYAVIEANRKFSELYPQVPLHLGVTEAGMLPDGEIKTRIALEQLINEGIGNTIRVSLTLADDKKDEEIHAAKRILADIKAGRFRSFPQTLKGLNVISCPSCSRVENAAFVKLAEQVKEATVFAKQCDISIAVMGCRVNGPGETDEADLGLWCAPTFVNLKKGKSLLGQFSYEEVVKRLVEEVKLLVDESSQSEFSLRNRR